MLHQGTRQLRVIVKPRGALSSGLETEKRFKDGMEVWDGGKEFSKAGGVAGGGGGEALIHSH